MRSMFYIIVTIAFIIIANEVYNQYGKIQQIRENPYLNGVYIKEYFKSTSLFDAIGVVLLMKNGTKEYMEEVRSYLYSPYTANTFWNRIIIERDVRNISSDMAAKYIALYPFDIKEISDLAFKSLYTSSDTLEIKTITRRLLLLSDHTKLHEWLNVSLMQENNPLLFEALAFDLLAYDIDVMQYFEKYLKAKDVSFICEPWLCHNTLSTEDKIIRNKILTNQNIENFLHFLHANAKSHPKIIESSIPLMRLLAESQNEKLWNLALKTQMLFLENKKEEAINILHKKNELHLYPEYGNKISFLDYGSAGGVLNIIGVYDVWEPDFAKDEIPAARRQQVLEQFIQHINTVRLENESYASMLFHELAHYDIQLAEEIARKYLKQPDSTFRKNIIVYLVREGSDLGAKYIDEAFIGNAQRTALFRSWFDYLESGAAKQYIKLAKHDYLEKGKENPLHLTMLSSNEIQALPKLINDWHNFINAYPWAPCTDDAYYQLANAYYQYNLREDALMVIDQYTTIKDTLPDTDADKLLQSLKRHIISDFYTTYPTQKE